MLSLSKSQYIRGLQCPKSLWLYKSRPDLRDAVDQGRQAVFDSGTDVGKLAQDLFPGGVEIAFDDGTLEEQIARTREMMSAGVSVLYEATFRHSGILAKADILRRTAEGWELYEVKSSTGLKDIYLEDIAVQYHVLKGAGIPIVRAGLVHINTGYIRQGALEPENLFAIRDLTDPVIAHQPVVEANLERLRAALTGGEIESDIGPHCFDPYECDFRGHCWSHIPENSVFDLRDHGRPDAFELYRRGIVHLMDVPSKELGWRQQLQVDGTLRRQNRVDIETVRSFLESLWYPLCFLDFETTYLTPVPLFDGTRPYEQVPFQFSLHVIDGPGAEPRHSAFLASPDEDPQAEFMRALFAALPENACILTYNQVFEIRILKELAHRLPHWRSAVDGITANVRDLMVPFRKRSVYLWPQNGSYSIKAVLPAMVPELSYEGLPVADGAAASQAYLRMRASGDDAERETLRSHLLSYCHLDTWGMVRIVEKLQEMIVGDQDRHRLSSGEAG